MAVDDNAVNKQLKPKTRKRLKQEIEEFEGKYFIEPNPPGSYGFNVTEQQWNKIYPKKGTKK